MTFECTELASPVGLLSIAVHDGRLAALCFEGLWQGRLTLLEKRFPSARWIAANDPAGIVTRLNAYFDGDRTALTDIEVETSGTPFQQTVWAQLRLIPVGQTRTYSQIALAIGRPTAVRAVGAANRSNPVGIVVPCHRVIGSDGTLTGFAGGLDNKRWLLEHENAKLVATTRAA